MGLLSLRAGCVPSLNPLYIDSQVTFDSALLGTWAETDSKETWVFKKKAEKEYQVINTEEDGRTIEFTGHLLRMEGETFLDLHAVKPVDLQDSDFLLPLHTFVRVSGIDSTPRMSYLEPEWLKEHLNKNPAAIQHAKVNDDIILTASTAQLQEFLLDHLKTEGAFSQPTRFKRRKGGQ
jgi:hypothetical protein